MSVPTGSFAIGTDFTFFYGAPGTLLPDALAATIKALSPALTATTQIGDVKLPAARKELTFAVRANNGQTMYRAGPLEDGIECSIPANHGDPFYQALKTCFANNTQLILGEFDGPYATAGTKGICGNFTVTKLEEDHALEAAGIVTCVFRQTGIINRDYTCP